MGISEEIEDAKITAEKTKISRLKRRSENLPKFALSIWTLIYLALSNMDRDTATAKANYCRPGIYGIYAQRPDHNTGNYVPYSLRTVSEFFNVPQSYLQIRFVRRGLRFIVLIRED